MFDWLPYSNIKIRQSIYMQSRKQDIFPAVMRRIWWRPIFCNLSWRTNQILWVQTPKNSLIRKCKPRCLLPAALSAPVDVSICLSWGRSFSLHQCHLALELLGCPGVSGSARNGSPVERIVMHHVRIKIFRTANLNNIRLAPIQTRQNRKNTIVF